MVEMNQLDRDNEIHVCLQSRANKAVLRACVRAHCVLALCNVKTRETRSAEILSKGSGNLQWEYSSSSLPNILEAQPYPQEIQPNNSTSKSSPSPGGSNTEVWCVQIN